MNENVVRSLSGIVYIFLLIFATLYSRESFLILFGLFLLQTVREFSTLIQLSKIPALIVSGILYLLFGIFFSNQLSTDLGLLLASLLVSFQLLLWLFSNQSKPIVTVTEKWVKLIGYIVLPFIFITKIPVVNNQFIPSIIIGIFILIWINDTFAYIVGKSFGKHKLFERISPKKTIEGFIGGLVFAIIGGVLLSKYYVSLPVLHWILIAVIASVFGTLGDLVESKFKRVAQVKDSGTIMPGHGGIYDRLDSIIFVAPFVFLFLKIISYVS
ncbi:MAG: phosphatidate cytidylyltransferase [Bacteroidota bacterium]